MTREAAFEVVLVLNIKEIPILQMANNYSTKILPVLVVIHGEILSLIALGLEYPLE